LTYGVQTQMEVNPQANVARHRRVDLLFGYFAVLSL